MEFGAGIKGFPIYFTEPLNAALWTGFQDFELVAAASRDEASAILPHINNWRRWGCCGRGRRGRGRIMMAVR